MTPNWKDRMNNIFADLAYLQGASREQEIQAKEEKEEAHDDGE